ncbi:MAG: hypothetical protein FWH05_04270 [Oscillospiraceae bacterium]|nr:hypothetical protein [Oscillospiraceae bacterium]
MKERENQTPVLKMEKENIKKLLEDIQLSPARSEHLAYACRMVRGYAEENLGKAISLIAISDTSAKVIVKDDDIEIHYKKTGKHYEECVFVALGLAKVVLSHIPISINKSPNSDFNENCYLAEKFLLLYSEMPNGAILRKKYEFSPTDVSKQVSSILTGYESNKIDRYKRNFIDEIFNEIFKTPKVESNIFDCEMRLISEYIEKTKGVKVRFKTLETCKIIKPKGELRTNIDEKQQPNVVTHSILYTSLENIKSSLHDKWEEDALSIQRAIIAHELAHVVCHAMHKYDKHAIIDFPHKEREALYFMRLLLEERERLYCGKEISSDEYKEACKKWEELVRLIAKNCDGDITEDELTWVFGDR